MPLTTLPTDVRNVRLLGRLADGTVRFVVPEDSLPDGARNALLLAVLLAPVMKGWKSLQATAPRSFGGKSEGGIVIVFPVPDRKRALRSRHVSCLSEAMQCTFQTVHTDASISQTSTRGGEKRKKQRKKERKKSIVAQNVRNCQSVLFSDTNIYTICNSSATTAGSWR